MHTQEPSRERIIDWLDTRGACYTAQEWVANQPDEMGARDLIAACPRDYAEWLEETLPAAAHAAYYTATAPAHATYAAARAAADAAYYTDTAPANATYTAALAAANAAYQAARAAAQAARDTDTAPANATYTAALAAAQAARDTALAPAVAAYQAALAAAHATYYTATAPAHTTYTAHREAALKAILLNDTVLLWLTAQVNGDDVEDLPCAT